jgi:hypothetical protein
MVEEQVKSKSWNSGDKFYICGLGNKRVILPEGSQASLAHPSHESAVPTSQRTHWVSVTEISCLTLVREIFSV